MSRGRREGRIWDVLDTFVHIMDVGHGLCLGNPEGPRGTIRISLCAQNKREGFQGGIWDILHRIPRLTF
jgi:hypothetical protein